MDIEKVTSSLRKGHQILAAQNANQKNLALEVVACAIDANRQFIIDANKVDVENARAKGMTESLVDRLSLDNKKIDGIIESIRIVISQTDPIGEQTGGWKTSNGLEIRQIRVPIGVVAIIYESRPNVTADAFCLAYKSGNAILLRGSSSALNSNKAIVKVIKDALDSEACKGFGVSSAIELAPCENHEEVEEILTAVGKIDLALPRGGAKLINMVVEKARVPVIETGAGVCHLYIDESADLEMACKIALNAKTQRTGVCNAIECIVINEKNLESFMPKLIETFAGKVELHCDEKSFAVASACLKDSSTSLGMTGTCSGMTRIVPAAPEDFGTEWLDYKCTIKTVASVKEAAEYINAHNTKHSESIITKSMDNARYFQAFVDAACVYVNASTRFTDGGEFGFGAELGISTQKLHARGPMGIKALTTTKYFINGEGQVR
ncbi:MAG: glutamate-5-semialdehyde dehydrogenase [Treponema sp.]|nr:glutamate-5-semialdehyde dehydrogenase [Treponema sp.]